MVLGDYIGVDGGGEGGSVRWAQWPQMNEIAFDDRLWRSTRLHQVASAKGDQSAGKSEPDDIDGLMVSASAEDDSAKANTQDDEPEPRATDRIGACKPGRDTSTHC